MKSLGFKGLAILVALAIAIVFMPGPGSVIANSPSFTPEPPQFLEPLTINVFPGPAFAAADLNGDGKIDVAVANYEGVDVVLGNGDGTFQPYQTFAVHNPFGANAIVIGDMNGDGAPDLVITTKAVPASVEILLGNGDGTFQPSRIEVVDKPASGLALGDFNGDGSLDVAVGVERQSLEVFLGEGDGTLHTGVNYPLLGGSVPSSLAVGDFNGDGNLDIAATNISINILLGNGDGTFQPTTDFEKASGAKQIQLADINSDGILDIVVLDHTGLGVAMGNGDGTFELLKDTPLPGSFYSFALGELNGDNKLDVVLSGQFGGNVNICLMVGNGNGLFRSLKTVYAAMGENVLVADVNSDGLPDIIQEGGVPGLALYLGEGNGRLPAPQVFNTNGISPLLAIGDFNGDGKPDVAALNNNSMISILPGNGKGTFPIALPAFNSVGSKAIAAADFNSDGKVDLVVLNGPAGVNGEEVMFLGNGDGTFQPPLTFPAGLSSLAMAVTDLNNDGKLDLAILNQCDGSRFCDDGAVSILLGNGDGTFAAATPFDAGRGPNSLVAADFDSDGKPDIAVLDTESGVNGDGGIRIFRGIGDGTFAEQRPVVVGFTPQDLVAADFNADGIQDLAEIDDKGFNVLIGQGNGKFKVPIVIVGVHPYGPVLIVDLNGDGRPEVALGTSPLFLYTGNGDGSFLPPVFLLSGVSPSSLAAVDVNGDGRPDLLAGENGLAVVVNTTPK